MRSIARCEAIHSSCGLSVRIVVDDRPVSIELALLMNYKHFGSTTGCDIQMAYSLLFTKAREEKVMKKRMQRGFTLIEMLVPIAIFGVFVLLPAVQ